MEGMTMAKKFLHISFTAVTTTLFTLYTYDSLFMPNMWHLIW